MLDTVSGKRPQNGGRVPVSPETTNGNRYQTTHPGGRMSQPFGFVSPAPVEKPMSRWDVWTGALTRPSVQTFERVVRNPKARSRAAHTWIFISALLGIAIVFAVLLAVVVVGLILSSPQGEAYYIAIYMVVFPLVVGLFVGSPLGSVLLGLGAIISVWITQAIARKLGGTGTYSRLVYAFAAYLAPLIFISILVHLVPFGHWLFYLLIIYGTVLNVIAVKAVNQFGWGKAIASNLVIFSENIAIALWIISQKGAF
jgi:hypothetical protein